jgi:hypothetical protein
MVLFKEKNGKAKHKIFTKWNTSMELRMRGNTFKIKTITKVETIDINPVKTTELENICRSFFGSFEYCEACFCADV